MMKRIFLSFAAIAACFTPSAALADAPGAVQYVRGARVQITWTAAMGKSGPVLFTIERQNKTVSFAGMCKHSGYGYWSSYGNTELGDEFEFWVNNYLDNTFCS
jgi:hypothetical protein